MAQEFKVVGKKVERVDAFERLTGQAKYASDVYLPGNALHKNPEKSLSPCEGPEDRYDEGEGASGGNGNPYR